LLRVLYTKGKRDEVRGVACLVLAQVLRRSTDEKKHEESEKLFQEAADKYADVKTAFDGTVGRKARSELFDLRYLSAIPGRLGEFVLIRPVLQGTPWLGTAC
jgi:hypothetical protein